MAPTCLARSYYSILAVPWLVAHSAASAQVPVVLASPVCEACEITISLDVVLGEDEGPAAIPDLSTITQMMDGRYIIGSNLAPYELMVFAADGRFLHRIGRAGGGPGEFGYVRWVRAHGDRLHVFDLIQRRHTVFSPDFDVLRVSPFPGNPLGDVVLVRDSLAVMNSLVLSRDHVGYVLHSFREDGALLRSMAEEPGGFRSDISEFVYARSLALSQAGTIWAAHWTRYRIEEWDLEGTLRRTFVRRADWFPDHYGSRGPPDPATPPPPRILDVREDDDSRLWVLVRVAAPTWHESLSRTTGAYAAESRYRIDDLDLAFDTVIEVVDPRAGTLLASTRVDPALVGFVGRDRVASFSTDAVGYPRIRIWRIQLP